jgi:N-acyl-D-amino-acid deacylase
LYDILIKNGRVYDGTGAPWFYGDIAVKDGKIVKIGNLTTDTAKKVIDAAGLAVSPGFIDIHSHSDMSFIINPLADSKVKQGVTTEVTGNCGSSVAPLTEMAKQYGKQLTDEDIDVTWSTMAEYFDALEEKGLSINVAGLMGHGTIRAGVMGFDRRPPTDAELDAMKALIAQAMDDGAVGMSTGLIYPPSSYADTAEIIELAKVVSEKNGLYFTHMRNEADALLESVKETIEIGRQACIPVQIAHHKTVGERNWGKVKQSLEMIVEARKQGVDVTLDQYPYIASSTSLTSIIPGWAHEGGRDALVDRLKQPETRARLKKEVSERMGDGWVRYVISRVSKQHNKRFEGMDLAAVAKTEQKDPCDAAFDLLVDEDGNVGQIKFGMTEEDVETVMKHPLVMIGSDGSSLADYGELGEGKPHPRNYGTFPRVLGKYSRQRGVLPLEEALRKMTSMPATRLGLWDRGVLRVGAWADITVFDPDTVEDVSDFQDPHKYARGIPYVIVNGALVVNEGAHTKVTPGRVLRRGK